MHLHLTESSAHPGMLATAEAEREYWSTSENGEWETFMLQEMVCGDVTEIYARYGARYFRLRDMCNLSHAQITTRIKEGFNLSQK
ncbi:TPA: hypothetical protein GM632_24990 [Klebsiella pneumoniae]|nr:hypothetical protein [Klebsiella pneumoniae]